MSEPPSDVTANAAAGNPFETTSFGVLLTLLEDGTLNAELSDQLRELVATLSNHVAEHGGKPKASIDLKLSVRLEGGVFMFEADYKTKLPAPPRSLTTMYATPGNGLSRHNPRQGDMFRDVSRPRDLR